MKKPGRFIVIISIPDKISSTNEVERLKRRVHMMLDYLEGHGVQSPLAIRMRQICDEDSSKGRVSRLRAINKEASSWVRYLPAQQYDELSHLLEHAGVGSLKVEDGLLLEKVKTILDQGKIANDREYTLLLHWVEGNYSNDSRQQLVEKINRMLADYHDT